ncbi:TrmH family RNA methyltransferase [Halocola ammonii]
MISKSLIKKIKSLQQKKFRKEMGLFVVEGVKMVEELLKNEFDWQAEEIIVREDYPVHDWLEDIQFLTASKKDMERMSGMKTAPEMIVVVKKKETQAGSFLENNCIVLDGIKDPGNFGTIIRTAEWFGIRHIVCSEETVDLYNPKTVQSTMGSIFRTEVFYTSLPEFIQSFRKSGGKCYGTTMHGQSLYETDFSERTAVVIGSESHGMSEQTMQAADEMIAIPGAIGAESLNAAMAAGIVCSEWFRKKGNA